MVEGMLCNQGCHTHIYIKDGKVYNVVDDQIHKCPVLEMAKMFGGKYNTIPMGYIKTAIFDAFIIAGTAHASRNIDEILEALNTVVNKLQYVTGRMGTQEKQNAIWASQLEEYKTKLVEDQNRRQQERDAKNKAEWTDGLGKNLDGL